MRVDERPMASLSLGDSLRSSWQRKRARQRRAALKRSAVDPPTKQAPGQRLGGRKVRQDSNLQGGVRDSAQPAAKHFSCSQLCWGSAV